MSTEELWKQRVQAANRALLAHRKALRLAKNALAGVPTAEAKSAIEEINDLLGENE